MRNQRVIDEPKTAEEWLDEAIDHLDTSSWNFAIFTDCVKKWREELKKDEISK